MVQDVFLYVVFFIFICLFFSYLFLCHLYTLVISKAYYHYHFFVLHLLQGIHSVDKLA